jgi:hypothetical protein
LAYDPELVLRAIDANSAAVFMCLAFALGFSFLYFFIALKMARKQRVYVEPFLGASVFFWHDLSFVLNWPEWLAVYGGHWWLKLWTIGLCGTVALEAYLIWQFIHYGHREILPSVSKSAFAAITMAGVLGTGAMWWLIKASLNDPLYLVTFAITAVWSIPFHTGIMLRRGNTAGQSIAQNLAVIVIFAAVSTALMIVAPAFRSLPYFTFLAVFLAWPLFNIWLINRLPASAEAGPEDAGNEAGNTPFVTTST